MSQQPESTENVSKRKRARLRRIKAAFVGALLGLLLIAAPAILRLYMLAESCGSDALCALPLLLMIPFAVIGLVVGGGLGTIVAHLTECDGVKRKIPTFVGLIVGSIAMTVVGWLLVWAGETYDPFFDLLVMMAYTVFVTAAVGALIGGHAGWTAEWFRERSSNMDGPGKQLLWSAFRFLLLGLTILIGVAILYLFMLFNGRL